MFLRDILECLADVVIVVEIWEFPNAPGVPGLGSDYCAHANGKLELLFSLKSQG